MPKFELSVSAVDDLEAIYRYTYNVFGELQAERYTRDLYNRFDLLADFPGMGTPARLGTVECLKFPSGSHVVYYRRTLDGIFVGRILHGALDPKKQGFGD